MECEITVRVVVDGVWCERGQVYDLPPHRCKELFDAGKAIPARAKQPEVAIEETAEDVTETPSRKRGKRGG